VDVNFWNELTEVLRQLFPKLFVVGRFPFVSFYYESQSIFRFLFFRFAVHSRPFTHYFCCGISSSWYKHELSVADGFAARNKGECKTTVSVNNEVQDDMSVCRVKKVKLYYYGKLLIQYFSSWMVRWGLFFWGFHF
jgi:hypothetical protein